MSSSANGCRSVLAARVDSYVPDISLDMIFKNFRKGKTGALPNNKWCNSKEGKEENVMYEEKKHGGGGLAMILLSGAKIWKQYASLP